MMSDQIIAAPLNSEVLLASRCMQLHAKIFLYWFRRVPRVAA